MDNGVNNNLNNNIQFDPMTGKPITNQNNNPEPVNNGNISFENQTLDPMFNNVNNSQVINNNNQNQTFSNGQTIQNYNYNSLSNINDIEMNHSKKFNKKLILIILGILIVIAGVIAFFYFKSKNNIYEGVNLNQVFDPDKPIVIKENDKYGYITSKGKVMLKPQYLSASTFKGDYAVVTVDNPNPDAYYDYIYQVIDKKGNVKATSESYSGPKYYSEYDIWVIEGYLYDGNLKKLSKESQVVEYAGNGFLKYENIINKTAGIMNSKGKVTYTYKYLQDESYISIEASDIKSPLDEYYCRVNIENKKYAIVNCDTGKVILDFTTNYISTYGDNIFNISNHSTFANLYRVYIQDDKILYKTNNSSGTLSYYDNGYVTIYDEINGSYQTRYLDIKTKEILDHVPSNSSDNIEISLMELTYGYKKFDSSYKYGLIKDDEIIIQAEYDDIEFVNSYLFNYMKNKKNQELVWVEKDKKTSLMNLSNQEIITTFDSRYVYDKETSTFVEVSLYENNSYSATSYIIYNILTGKSKKFDKDADYEIFSNYITVEKDNKKIYYNTELEQIYVENI